MKVIERILAVCSVYVVIAFLSLVLVEGSPLRTSDGHHLQSEIDGPREKVRENGALSPKYLQPTLLTRHIRSVEQHEPQAQQLSDVEQDDNIQSSSVSEEESEVAHKGQKPFVSTDIFPLQNFQVQTSPKGTVLHKWLFPGTGQSQFSRGQRRDSHFIRFGRNSNNLDFDGFSSGANNNGNKKNNFIRLGRENPRRNNFIRLGRSGGAWGNNERFGSKVGYFPDYYSQLLEGNPTNILDYAGQNQLFDSAFALQG